MIFGMYYRNYYQFVIQMCILYKNLLSDFI